MREFGYQLLALLLLLVIYGLTAVGIIWFVKTVWNLV